MAIEKVRAFFKEYGMDGQIMVFEESSATVEMAAHALKCAPQRIAKTLSFLVGERYVLVVTAGDARIDNAKFKAKLGCKAKMPSADEVLAKIGHAIGGVCPFAIPVGIPVYCDVSLQRFDTVFPACGSGNSAIELTIPQLELYARCTEWVDVCKGWQTATDREDRAEG